MFQNLLGEEVVTRFKEAGIRNVQHHLTGVQ